MEIAMSCVAMGIELYLFVLQLYLKVRSMGF